MLTQIMEDILLAISYMTPQSPLLHTAQQTGLAPAASPGHTSDGNQSGGDYAKKKHPQGDDGDNGDTVPDEPLTPITPPSQGGVMRRHIPVMANEAVVIDPVNPPAALQRRARAYERMMPYY
jgi:hypothetical protein